jgi:hypothetical protein
MDDMGIAYPYSLAFDMRGQLWVGCFIKSNQIKSYSGGKQSGAKVNEKLFNGQENTDNPV